MRWALISSSLILLSSTTRAAVFRKFEELPTVSFDYIIVGAGNAGNVLANRLSENPAVSVLVVEAGPSDEDVLPAIAPFLALGLANTIYDWNYTTVPQNGVDNRAIPYNRGRLLGGSSTANIHMHQYGSADDYDKLAAITGDSEWAWKRMKKYVHKHERFIKPAEVADGTAKGYIEEDRGTDGMVPISLSTYRKPFDDLVLSVTRELPEDFPFNPDTSGGDNTLGLGWVRQSIANGTRQSSSTTYLRSAASRPNLFVLIETQVLKLLPTGNSGGKPAFRGVLLSSTNPSPNYVLAKREVILSAGSIGTPQLLLLSGIGPKEDLEQLNIPTLVNSPSVGHNFSDHIFVPYWYEVKGLDTLDDTFRQPDLMQAAIGEWMASRTGLIANGYSSQIGFFRFPSNTSIFDSTPDPSSGPKAAHWEMMFCNFWLARPLPVPDSGTYITLMTSLTSPVSRGFVKLASINPLDEPIIDPRYLTADYDKKAMREALRVLKRFASSKTFSEYIVGAVGSSGSEEDEPVDEHIRKNLGTTFHGVGTGAISPDNAAWGVVDSRLRVKGADGLRIVDASIWPFVPSAHTQGPTYLIAERAADIIIDEYQPISLHSILRFARNVWNSASFNFWGSSTSDIHVEL
ncbi:hypothetical protein CPB83DRAFT_850001 [Crepidotus variabilis]|uniref:pyranose dehydrogenase (acceptor) n=1 Tax=Crepidotus variabilis TaxID=179855 RepID=A0A9P6EKY2_9AGAR|nr:hypothetical protein CPB83DRAFT_850001 [Crepidotus variabilis]